MHDTNKISILDCELVTVDELKEKMGVHTGLTDHPHPEKIGGQLHKYKRLRASAFQEAFNKASNIYMDDHGDLVQQDQEFLEKAKKHGYKIILIHSTVDPGNYLNRQIELSKKMGYSPAKNMDWAVGAFKSSLAAFSKHSKVCDHAFIVDRAGWDNFIAYDAKNRKNADNVRKINDRWKNVKTKHLKRKLRKHGR